GRIKNAPVTLTEIPHESFMDAVDDARSRTILSSSFRLDTVLSEVINEGRSKSKSRVARGKLKVTPPIVTAPSFRMEPGDIVSVRHFGRFPIVSLIAEASRGKYRILVSLSRDG